MINFSISKKKKKKQRIDAAFERVYAQLDNTSDWEDPKKQQQYILDSCEHIIATTKQIEREKTEYRVVTQYLTDITTLENLPSALDSELKDCAKHICDINKSIEHFHNSRYNITESQFAAIKEDEDDMPAIINRFVDNEKYRATVKKEMHQLEAKKSACEMQREEVAETKDNYKMISIISVIVFVSLFILLLLIDAATGYDTGSLVITLFLLAAIAILFIFSKQMDLKRDSRRLIAELNNTIAQLNVVRMKFVNADNGLEYVKEKYDVKNGMELNYVWEQYMDKVRDTQRYRRNNDDLELYTNRLIRILDKIDIKDRRIWVNRTSALVNPNDMKEARHKLVVRRQKIRQSMDEDKKLIQKERDEIDRVMLENQQYMPEISEIVKTVDKLCNIMPSRYGYK